MGALRFSSRHALETRQKRCMVLPASFMLSCSGHDRQRLESPFAHPSPSSTSPPTIPYTHRNRRTTIKSTLIFSIAFVFFFSLFYSLCNPFFFSFSSIHPELIQPTWQQCAILYSKSHREGCYIIREEILLLKVDKAYCVKN